MKDKKVFEYKYSASKQTEIENIIKKYIPKEEDKLEQLKRLDKSAEKPGTIIAIVLGVVGTLLLGIGMSCSMVWAETLFVPGIIIGSLGIIFISLAYPSYSKITQKQRQKLAPQILALSEELLK